MELKKDSNHGELDKTKIVDWIRKITTTPKYKNNVSIDIEEETLTLSHKETSSREWVTKWEFNW